MRYEFGRSPCHYLPTVLERLGDLNNSVIPAHERGLLARANMLAYELTDEKKYFIKSKKLGREILKDILTKESYIPREEEFKLLYYLHKQESIIIEEKQISRILDLKDNWGDPDVRLAALLLAYQLTIDKADLKDQIFDLLESLPREERLWPYATAYIMSEREFDLPPDILELAKEVSGLEEVGPYLDKIFWIKSMYEPDFGPRNLVIRKKLAKEISGCDQPIDLLFVLGYMRNENVFDNIQRSIHEVESSLDFAPTVDSAIKVRKGPTEDVIIFGRGSSTIKEIGCQGTIYLGRVSEKGDHDLYGKKVLLDAVFPHVVFISGHRGSGKSYTLGVIAEELAKANLGVGVILIDPIGIFWALKNTNSDNREKLLLERWGLTPQALENIEVFTPVGIYEEFPDETVDSPFALKPSDLGIEDWCKTFDIGRYEVRGTILEKALQIIQDSGKEDYTINDIIAALDDPSIEENYRSDSIRAIRSRMSAAKGWGIFAGEGTPLSRLSRPNKISVLDISNPRIGDSLRALLVGIIARKILEARIHSSRGELFEASGEEVDESAIPVTWLLVDEAHVLVPTRRKTAASDPLIEYAKQGRKPGCALVLVTQQPSAMHKDIMSQIDLMVTHLLTFDDDIKAFLKRVPSSVPEQFENPDFIRSMPTGVGLLSDQHTQKRSLVVKVRPRVSLHAGREAIPASLRAKMKQKQPSTPSLNKRDVIVEETRTSNQEIEPEEAEPLIPEPVPPKDEEEEEEEEEDEIIEKEPKVLPKKPTPKKVKEKETRPTRKATTPTTHQFPKPQPHKFPKKMILSILERKLEYGQNDFLFDGSKSTRFEKWQKSGIKNGGIQEILPPIINQLESIGWEIIDIIEEQTSVVILMRLESATLGIAYTLVDNKTAISALVVAKERFRRSIFDKIFQLK